MTKHGKKTEEMPLWFRRLLLAVLLLFILVILGTAAFFINFFASGGDVIIEVSGPAEVLKGVPFEVEVNIVNETDSRAQGAELAFFPSDGIKHLGNLGSDGVFTEQIGDLGEGSIAKRTYRLLSVGGEEEEVVFNLSYSSAHRRFGTEKTWKVRVAGSAVRLEVEKPEQILPGSVFELDIRYENTSNFDLPEAVLELEYPTSFRFVSASLSPDSLNNRWRLGELRSGSSGNLQIRGTLESGEASSFVLPVVFSGRFLGEDFPIAEENVELNASPSPVGLEISVNRRSDYVARVGDRLTYTIRYDNSSGIALSDVVIRAELLGELYDFLTLSSNGNVNTLSRTVTWDVSRIPALRLLGAGSAGEMSLEIKLKDQFPITRLNDKNFSLRFRVELTSPSVPYYLAASETRAERTLETKVAGLVRVDAKAFYRDALSKIVNGGPMPPKVNEETEYTVHWLVVNYATDVSDAVVRASLPPNVRWTGIVKSNTDSVPLYEPQTNEVVWTIGKIRATKGVLDEPLAAVFQIAATPVSSDLGNFKELLSLTTLRALDDFTGLEVIGSDVAINSSLPDDVTVGQNGGRVQP
ncbi:MAG: hypothetical protein HY378_01455 [Candidatus Brennerbacteria bacterium]|nr:hypothetical protein [Candidatus Brennerbacteria bacterium]